MPELPEVEVIRHGLNELIIGKEFTDVEFDWPKSFPNANDEVNEYLLHSRAINVLRKGKTIIIELSTNYSLAIHLKMTGQLVYRSEDFQFGSGHPTESLIGHLPDKSTRVIFTFLDNSKLFFNDQRKFGWVKLIPTNLIKEISFYKKLGPEPLLKSFNWQILQERLLRRSNTSIKAALLDQGVLAGIGNIYADESLWKASIHPATLVKHLTNEDVAKLTRAIKEVLRLSIKNGGSTDRNYVNVRGQRGNYLIFANVFRLNGKPCKRCGTNIIKIRVAGRGTHLCPSCQKVK